MPTRSRVAFQTLIAFRVIRVSRRVFEVRARLMMSSGRRWLNIYWCIWVELRTWRKDEQTSNNISRGILGSWLRLFFCLALLFIIDDEDIAIFARFFSGVFAGVSGGARNISVSKSYSERTTKVTLTRAKVTVFLVRLIDLRIFILKSVIVVIKVV